MADHADDRREQGAAALSATRAATSDTIAAIATPQGRGGIGVVRVSGCDLSRLAGSLIGRVPAPRRAGRAAFLDHSGAAIDDGIAIWFPAPASYTGEDVLELHGHGGIVVMQLLLRRCLELGARIAEPGEFTRRGFLNGRIDLAQAEAVIDVIDAASEAAARGALRSLRGEFSAAVGALDRKLVELRVQVEGDLDFPEDEVGSLTPQALAAALAGLRGALARTLEQARQGSILRSGIHIVLAGRPNVGKSSLLNRLAGEDVAIVTEIPGTTRDALRQMIQIDGVPMNIIDTAGLRETRDRVEALGVERTWQAIERADVLLLMVEAPAGVTAEDRALLERLPARLTRVLVHNKIDLLGEGARERTSEEGAELWISAKSGEGLELLRARLLACAGWHGSAEDVFLARERHLAALARAGEALARAEAACAQSELLAEELRLAHRELGAITGEFSSDDLLGEIFSRFCIGK